MRLSYLIPVFLCLVSPFADARDLDVAIGVKSPLELRQPFPSTPAQGSTSEINRFNEAVAREICHRLVVRCNLHFVTFAEILPGVESQRYQLGFGNFLRTPERSLRVFFSDALWRSSSRLVSTEESLRKYQFPTGQELTLDSLSNVRVATITASQQHRYLERIASQRGITVVALTTPAEVFEALRDNTVDFVLVVSLLAYEQIKTEDPQMRRYRYVGPGITGHLLGGSVHIALPLGAHTLQREVNPAILEMRNDGTYNRIAMQFLPINPD